MANGEITIETLMAGFSAIMRHDEAVRQSGEDYSAMMKPYLNKPASVFIAAHRLAFSAAHRAPMHPSDAEACFALIRAAGMEWGREEPQA